MSNIVKPTRAEIDRMTSGASRMTRAIELLFGEVAAATNPGDTLAAVLGRAAGSAVWYDFNNAQSVPANVWTTLDWSNPAIRVNEVADTMPDGFVNNGRISVPDRQWFLMRVDVRFSMADATANILRVGLTDTDGGLGTFAQPSQATLLGAGVADESTFQLLSFGTSIIPSGALPQVFSDGPVNITSTQAFFARLGSFG